MAEVTRRRITPSYQHAIIGVWFALLLFFALLLLQWEFASLRREFDAQAHRLYLVVSDRIALQETSLEGFANYLAMVPKLDLERARRFVRRWQKRYPQVYMMEVAERVTRDERAAFEHMMRRAGYSDFAIHTFGYDTDRRITTSPNRAVYYPIIFVEPELPKAAGVLGLDIADTSATLRDALTHSIARQTLVGSRPFQLIEDRPGYLLYRPVVSIETAPTRERDVRNELYALVVVDAQDLIPAWANQAERIAATLRYVDTENHTVVPLAQAGFVDRQPHWLDRLLPLFEDARRVPNTAQPLVLSIRQRVQWRDVNQQIFLVWVFVALSTFWVALRVQRHVYQDQAQKEAERHRLDLLANYDPITGLPNRTLLLDRIDQARRSATRRGTSFAVVFIDLDDFKSINDRFGHEAGNRVLAVVGARLTAAMRDADTVARIHGDEFVVLLNDTGNVADLKKVARKIRTAFACPIVVGRRDTVVTASIGYAVFPDDGETAELLLEMGDKRMYREKNATKRNSIVVDLSESCKNHFVDIEPPEPDLP